MPFVFVHGVNNRRGSGDYEREVLVRDAFLKNIVAPEVGVSPEHLIYAPYWGGSGVRFSHDLAVIPTGHGVEAFGGEVGELSPSLGIALANELIVNGDRFHSLARRHPDVAIDLLFDSIAEGAKSNEEISAVVHAYQLVQARLREGDVQWLAADSDDEVLNRILDVLSPIGNGVAVETFGAASYWGMLKEGLRRMTLWGPDQLSHAVVGAARRPVTSKIATFIGDAFRYLAERGDGTRPGPIAETVIASLLEASTLAQQKGEPLIVISHSFGGEIVYDVLTHYADVLNLEINVDIWVTVGSQVGLFEEMSLLWTSPGRMGQLVAPAKAIASPKRVTHWLNIIDTNDVLGFLIEPVFSAAETRKIKDYQYDTGFPLTGAHSGYFKWPSFYKRLAARIKAATL